MRFMSNDLRFLSEEKWQSLICTLLFLIVITYPIFFSSAGASYSLKLAIIACIPCYFLSYVGAAFGKKFLGRPYLGGD